MTRIWRGARLGPWQPVAARGDRERNLDPGIKLVLEEIRDLRVEMRADRQRADEERRRRDEEWRRESREFRAEFRAELARRDAAFLKAFREVRTVGLAIVKT